jgi:pilus assembly protein Flp/PilA
MKDRLLSLYTRFKCREEGQAVVEYAVLLALILVAAIVVIGTLGGQVTDAFQAISDKLKP